MARRGMNYTRRRLVYNQIPPNRCTANSRRSGQRCQRWANVGSSVCYMHGGASPQAKASAERQISLAEAMRRSPRRAPWEVMEDVAHSADILYQDARRQILAGTFTAASLEKFVAALERAHRLSNVNVQTGLAQRKQVFAEAQANLIHKVLLGVMARIGATAEQRKQLPMALRAEIEPLLAIEADMVA